MVALTEPAVPPPTDEPFLTLPENRLAAAAVERLGESCPDDPLRLVYVYGPSGVGKSHLVREFLWKERRRPTPLRIASLTAAGFVAELDRARGDGTASVLRETCLALDLFVLEDFAAAERKPETQRLLAATIDETLAAGGRVLVTASRAPGEAEQVSPRLTSRLQAGACVGIGSPGPDSRARLLAAFARLRHLAMPTEVLQLLAEGLPASPRELKAAVARLDELAHADRVPLVNRTLAERVLTDAVAAPAPSLRQIAGAVAKEFGLRVTDLRAPGRTNAVALPRQVAMALARDLTGLPLERVAGFFGRQNHGTVIHARKRLAARLEDDPTLRRHVSRIRRRIGGPR